MLYTMLFLIHTTTMYSVQDIQTVDGRTTEWHYLTSTESD